MKIRIPEGFEQKLETTLVEIDRRFSDENQKPIDLQKEWAKPGSTTGVVGGFAKGTLRVLTPCKLVLCESIIFNPNPGYRAEPNHHEIDPDRNPQRDWFPYGKQDAYSPGKPIKGVHGAAASNAYRIGFLRELRSCIAMGAIHLSRSRRQHLAPGAAKTNSASRAQPRGLRAQRRRRRAIDLQTQSISPSRIPSDVNCQSPVTPRTPSDLPVATRLNPAKW